MWCDVMCVPSRLEETCQNFRLCWFALSCKVVLKYVFCAFSLSEKLVGSLLMCKWRVRQYTDVLYKLLLVDFSRLRKQMAFGIVGSKRAFFVRQQEVHQWFKNLLIGELLIERRQEGEFLIAESATKPLTPVKIWFSPVGDMLACQDHLFLQSLHKLVAKVQSVVYIIGCLQTMGTLTTVVLIGDRTPM